jgi:response regulator RpfG family c-di-GMP phosphodiesterase/serine/threonine protein kinase
MSTSPFRPGVSGPTVPHGDSLPADSLIRSLLNLSIALPEDWEALAEPAREAMLGCQGEAEALALLVNHGLLTQYQADRVAARKMAGLILGNYRVLDRIGAGGMGVVFKGEHIRMRRPVAIKVLPPTNDLDDRPLRRFLAEMRAVAQLQHANIVSAIDDGESSGSGPDAPPVYFFVMEYVPGKDLEDLVLDEGPLPIGKACGLVYQVAGALAEAHRCDLIHRDVKPSNIRVTPGGVAKLLDFGLVRDSQHRMTAPGIALGTIDYLAPEQARDASLVDGRADVYALGGTLFWCLTGQVPFASNASISETLIRRLTEPPRSVMTLRPDCPAGLDAIVARMMASEPGDRYPTCDTVMTALLPYLEAGPGARSARTSRPTSTVRSPGTDSSQEPRVLVVDDNALKREFCSLVLREAGIPCDTAEDAEQALAVLGSRPYELVLSDWVMPGMSGMDLCRALRRNPPSANFKILLFSEEVTDDVVAQVLEAGADDYLNKLFSPVQLVARVKASLRLKNSQDKADRLNRNLLTCNAELERTLAARDSDLLEIRNALVLSLADLVCHRDIEPVAHTVRLQGYCRCLAEEAAHSPAFGGRIDHDFIALLECCAPLHDIGKAGLPDHLLTKGGSFDADERLAMETHTILGAETLKRVAERHGSAVVFLQMAIEVARHHHERYDGAGYPDGLVGEEIPLSARLVAVGDTYDGLRTRRAYKPALPHTAAVQMVTKEAGGQFDPALMDAFRACAPRFERIFRETPD